MSKVRENSCCHWTVTMTIFATLFSPYSAALAKSFWINLISKEVNQGHLYSFIKKNITGLQRHIVTYHP